MARDIPVYKGPASKPVRKAKPLKKSGTGGTGGSGGGGGGGSSAADAKKLKKQQNEQARDQATREVTQINANIDAKRGQRAVNKGSKLVLDRLVNGLTDVRDAGLKSIDQSLRTKMDQIKRTYDTSLKDFRQNQLDNESSEADSSFANLMNRARESGDLLAEAMSQGAGESDTLRAQMQAVRNWSANQAEVNRSYFDTRTSINAGITDLNNSTRTAMINEETSANSSRSQLWDDYYNQASDVYTQMANLDQQNYLLGGEIKALKGSRKQPLGVLSYLGKGKDYENYKTPKVSTKLSKVPDPYVSSNAKRASDMATRAWDDPGVSAATKNWTGEAGSSRGLNSAGLIAAPVNLARKAPEGATLRKW